MKHLLEDLSLEYEKLQQLYGDPNLRSITFGGCTENPDICLVFMNPTARNITASKEWKGIHSPWIGTKNVWQLFYQIGMIEKSLLEEIQALKGKEWTPEFAVRVYEEVRKHRFYITNLAKCTQVDARALPDCVYQEYLDLFYREMEIVNPKVIVLFGNQVSSIVLQEKISVSLVRKKEFLFRGFHWYSVYYPVGNGRFHIDKSIEDILYIRKNKNR